MEGGVLRHKFERGPPKDHPNQDWSNLGVNATFNHISVISWQSVLLVEDTGVPGENHWSAATSHWQTLSHQFTSPWVGFELI